MTEGRGREHLLKPAAEAPIVSLRAWIDTSSYGCTNTERIHYTYEPPPPGNRAARGPSDPSIGAGGSREHGNIFPHTVNNDPMKQPDVKLRELNPQPSTPGPREEV